MTSPSKIAYLKTLRKTFPGHSSQAQRNRVLAALRRSPCTTYELMRFADVFDPRPRVLELRRQGLKIITSWVHEPTESGELHRIGVYALLRDKKEV